MNSLEKINLGGGRGEAIGGHGLRLEEETFIQGRGLGMVKIKMVQISIVSSVLKMPYMGQSPKINLFLMIFLRNSVKDAKNPSKMLKNSIWPFFR